MNHSDIERSIEELKRQQFQKAERHELDAALRNVASLERTVGELGSACDGLRATCEALLSRIERLETPVNA